MPKPTYVRRRAQLRRPRLEQLESRVLLATVTLLPTADNTLFENSDGSLSNGAGDFFFVGRRILRFVKTFLFDTTQKLYTQ